MHFGWSEDQNELYQGILRFTQNIAGEAKTVPWTRTQWRTCSSIGLAGLSVPTRYGGRGLDALTTACGIEAFGKGCRNMGLVFSMAAHLFACTMPLVEHGDERQKEQWLPGLCSGELIGANAITEQEAGSDVFALKTRAVREGESYLLTGEKSYVSNGPLADLMLVYASTNPKHGYLGITAFLVEKDLPGLTMSDPFDKMGLQSTPACRVKFEACRVPVTHRLGAEGQGYRVFQRSMLWERACLFAAYLGMMDYQLSRCIDYVQKRRQFGSTLIKKQAIAHRLAEMKLRLEAARLLLYRACWLFDQGEEALLDISLSKLAVSEAAIRSSLDALHIHGSTGFQREEGFEEMVRDAIPSTIFSGTSEVLRDIIANELISE